MNEDGHTSSIREKILTITVKKGWKPGTKITFPEEGDQGPNNVPGKFQPHPVTYTFNFKVPSSFSYCPYS